MGSGVFSEGSVRFHIAVIVRPGELAAWSPERIAAFFAGITQVLEARHGEPPEPGGGDE